MDLESIPFPKLCPNPVRLSSLVAQAFPLGSRIGIHAFRHNTAQRDIYTPNLNHRECSL
jgi:hypothetical protein